MLSSSILSKAQFNQHVEMASIGYKKRYASSVRKSLLRICKYAVLSVLCLASFGAQDLVGQQQQKDGTTTWLIVRHAEKDAQELLNEAGKLRAKKLKKIAELFRIKAVYSTDYPRTKDTAKPTAEKLGVEIQTYKTTNKKWFDDMKQKHKGEAVLIVGHSNTIGQIAKGFGGVGDFSVVYEHYDNLFIVTNEKNGNRSLRMKYGQ